MSTDATMSDAFVDWEKRDTGVIAQIEREDGTEKYNRWFEDHRIKAYVRKTRRDILGERVNTLEIGAVEVREDFRREGVFKRFLAHFEDFAYSRGRIVYIENVMDDWLQKYLEDYGFKRIHAESDCFYKSR